MAEELRFAIKCRASRQRPVLKRSCSKCSLASGAGGGGGLGLGTSFRPGSQMTHRHLTGSTYVPARRSSVAAHSIGTPLTGPQSNPNVMTSGNVVAANASSTAAAAAAAAAAMMNACTGNGMSIPNDRNNTIQLSLSRQQSLNLQHNLQQLLLDLKQQNGGSGSGGPNGDTGATMPLPPPPPPPITSGRLIGGVSGNNNPLMAAGLIAANDSNGDYTPNDYGAAFGVRNGYDEYDDDPR